MKSDVRLLAATKIGLGKVLAAALSLMASHGTLALPNRVSVSGYEVTIQVTLFDAKSGEALKDYSEVAVWLVPARPFQPASLGVRLPHYRMMQHNKSFKPHLLVVPMGSIVEFRNSDPWFHSAFSLFGGMRFNLGPQQPGVEKAVRFDRAGVVYVFCNLHPQMDAVILTVQSLYFGVSDKAGHVSIRNVPPGKYFLHAWYENAASQPLKPLHRAIVLGDERRGIPRIFLALAKQVPINGERRELGTAVPMKESTRSSLTCRISPARSARRRPESPLRNGARFSQSPIANRSSKQEGHFPDGD